MEIEKNPRTRPLFKKLLQLEDRIKGKSFPLMKRVKQISVYACGPATLEMLFSFVGLKISQRSVIKSLRAEKKIRLYGIDVKDMAKAAAIAGKKNFVFWKKANASLNDLNLIINKYESPVGVEWQGIFYEQSDEDSGHYGVITKFDKESGFLRIADPYFNGFFHYNGIDRKLKISEFFKKWWDVNDVKIKGTSKLKAVKDIRMMFVITPKGTSWPRKLGMTP